VPTDAERNLEDLRNMAWIQGAIRGEIHQKTEREKREAEEAALWAAQALDVAVRVRRRLKKLSTAVEGDPKGTYAALLALKREFDASGVTISSVTGANDKVFVSDVQDDMESALAVATDRATRVEIMEFEQRATDHRRTTDADPKGSYEALLALEREFDATHMTSRPIQDNVLRDAVGKVEILINYCLLDAKVKMTRVEVDGFEQRLRGISEGIAVDPKKSHADLVALKRQLDATDIASRSLPKGEVNVAIKRLFDGVNNALASAKSQITRAETRAGISALQQRFHSLSAGINANPQRSFLLLSELSAVVIQKESEVLSVNDDGNKATIRQLADAISHALAVSKTRMTLAETEELTECLRYEEEMPLLNRALESERAREELLQFEASLRRLALPRRFVLASMIGTTGCAFFFGIVIQNWAMFMLSLPLLLAELIIWIATSPSAQEEINREERLRRLRGQLASDNDWERIEEAFGPRTASGYDQMVRERKALIAKVRG
jgi:hypothetical protein